MKTGDRVRVACLLLVVLFASFAAADSSVVAKIDGLRVRFAAPTGFALGKIGGSAWCLSPDCSVLVTNHHVAAGFGQRTRIKGVGIEKRTSATGKGGTDAALLRIWSGKIELTKVRDLALLEMRAPLARKGMHSTPVFGGRLRPGEEAVVSSYPNGRLRVVEGVFTAELADGTLLFTFHEPLETGSSGGLICNTNKQAVGTVFAVAQKDHRLVVGVPMWSLADFVRKVKPSLAQLFPAEMYRPSSVIVESLPDPVQIDESSRMQMALAGQEPELPLPLLATNEVSWPLPTETIAPLPQSAEVEVLRAKAGAMARSMKNFVALQSLTLQGGRTVWEHEIQVIDGVQRFRTPNGEVLDQLPLPHAGVVPGQEWYRFIAMLADPKLYLRYMGRVTVNGEPMECFEYSASADEKVCRARVDVVEDKRLWEGDASCSGDVWVASSDFHLLRVTQEMRLPQASHVETMRLAVIYGQLSLGTVPAKMFLEARLRSGQLLRSEAKFADYRLFQAKSTIRW